MPRTVKPHGALGVADSSEEFVVDEGVLGEIAVATPRVGLVAAHPLQHPVRRRVATREVIRFDYVGYVQAVPVNPLPTDAIVAHGVDEPER